MNIRGQGHRRNIGHLARGIWRAGNGASCLRERRPSDREVPGNPELLRKGNVTLPPTPAPVLVGHAGEPEERRCGALVFHGSPFPGRV